MGIFSKLFKQTSNIQEKAFCYDGLVLEDSNNYKFEGMAEDDKLIEEGYSSNTDVYAIIKKLCEVSSDVPFVVKEKQGDDWVVSENSRLQTLLDTPNELQSGKDFRFETMLYLLNTGDWFWRPTVSTFDLVTELVNLPSNLIEIQ